MPLEAQLVAFGEQAEVLGSINVGVMWDRLRGEFLNAFVEFERQGLTGVELDRAMDAFMGELSERPLVDISRRSSGIAYNQGRSAEILSQPGLEFVVYSSVLDSETCEPCRFLDSEVFEIGSSDYFNNQPGAQCEGGSRCRCIYVEVDAEFGVA